MQAWMVGVTIARVFAEALESVFSMSFFSCQFVTCGRSAMRVRRCSVM